MNNIQIYGLLINLIVYIIMIFPICAMSFIPKVYKNKKSLIIATSISIIIETAISLTIYSFPHAFFKIFSNTPGIVNYSVYAFKILFIPSSLYGIKILVPKYLSKNKVLDNNILSKDSSNTNKSNAFYSFFYKIKIATLIFSKIAITFFLIILGYIFFNTKGILFAIPLADSIYIILYTIMLLYITK